MRLSVERPAEALNSMGMVAQKTAFFLNPATVKGRAALALPTRENVAVAVLQ